VQLNQQLLRFSLWHQHPDAFQQLQCASSQQRITLTPGNMADSKALVTVIHGDSAYKRRSSFDT
jgi:6-phosphogluconolactonase/glucosamine-6-phosphate isomerase/deaminase